MVFDLCPREACKRFDLFVLFVVCWLRRLLKMSALASMVELSPGRGATPLHHRRDEEDASPEVLRPSPDESKVTECPSLVEQPSTTRPPMHVWDLSERSLPPLMGREVEHQSICQFLLSRLAMDATQRCLLLCGPCGVGKSTTVSRVLPEGFAIRCQVEVPVVRLSSMSRASQRASCGSASSSPSSGGRRSSALHRRGAPGAIYTMTPQDPLQVSEVSATATELSLSPLHKLVTRDIRPIHVNCTDLSASKLIEEIITKLTYHQRKSDLLEAKEALIRSAVIGGGGQKGEATFVARLECLVDTVYLPRLHGTASSPSSSVGRSSASRTSTGSSNNNGACDKSVSATAAAWARCPLHVLVLDEADSSKSTSVLRNLFLVVERCPLWFGLICISNDRWLTFLPRDDASATAHVRALPFSAYSAEVLQKIGALAVQESKQGHVQSDGSLSHRCDVDLAPSAAAFAAKTSVLNYCGDARKVKELCRRAADEVGAAAVAQSSAAAAAVPTTRRTTLQDISNVTKRAAGGVKRARSPDAAPTKTTTVSLKDMMRVTSTVTARPAASSIVVNLPEQATYLLCCVVALARRKAVAACLQRAAVGGVNHGAVVAAVKATDTNVLCDCGELTEPEVYRLYARLMREFQFNTCNREAAMFSLELLKSRGVITGTKAFVCTGEWTLAELEGALIDEGTRLVRLQAELLPPERAELLTNKFAEAFHKLKVS
jgi:Cdc6-like AAA superfamily ATPase